MKIEMAGTGAQTAMAGDLPVAPAPRTRAYVLARRHSRFVRFLKFALPFGAIMGIVLMVGFAYFDPFRNMAGITMGPVSLSGSQITMQSPRLTGFRNDGRPYEVIASAATQDVKQPTMVELKDLRGKISLDDKGGIAFLQADTGYLDTQKENLNIKNNVVVRTDNGQQILMKSAAVDFKSGRVVSQEPVSVTLQNGTIDADAMEVLDSGRVLIFTGRVQSVFDKIPGPDVEADTDTSEPATSTNP